MKDSEILNIVEEVFDIEIDALLHVKKNIGDSFVTLVKKTLEITENGGKIVVCGIGKSGHIGKKIAATLASTGSPSVFLHPVEAMHGDLGVVQKGDILLSLSYSGESDELLQMIPAVKRFDIPVACLTGSDSSRLAKFSDIIVKISVPREACPFNLAPTATTTAMLAAGDALAMTLLKLKKFTKEDYGRLHPSGAIGRAISMKVSDIMRTGNKIAILPPNATVRETILKMTSARTGSAIIVTEDGKLMGIFTDGDFRRNAEKDMSILDKQVQNYMTKTPSFVFADDMAIKILKIVESKHIDDIVVVDSEGKVVGLVDIQDLPSFKLI
ncbi:MAG TPA: KpsF/GutQ family sugar-phosphate isomerase [Victivallales bacterium]|nr:KpsF/GutQ family sugar-phosphate isomerase [Victivallales bacterium]HPO89567.1 KpsF/GutQ family sugar-phosphate isomerase [Victivallales bacterium]HRR27899.1 KpsF/GutQ family sugar-phosphate isomerase [Victivallales bacterium]HRU00662.1 KpsF/GutQ family sugar-phosphate isomerase [Victivallales bacterium]